MLVQEIKCTFASKLPNLPVRLQESVLCQIIGKRVPATRQPQEKRTQARLVAPNKHAESRNISCRGLSGKRGK